jgi:drug/metabolite transporter (DMT)-like permease
MKNQFLHAATHLGDTAVILPLTGLLISILWRFESRRAAWLLLRALLACMVMMGTLKVVFLSCGYARGIGIVSPSGHSSLATFFYGVLAVLVWTRQQGTWRHAAALFFIFVASAVFSRSTLWRISGICMPVVLCTIVCNPWAVKNTLYQRGFCAFADFLADLWLCAAGGACFACIDSLFPCGDLSRLTLFRRSGPGFWRRLWGPRQYLVV